MGIISLIILISNVLIYLALPKVYVNNKQKESDKIIEALIEQVSKSDNEESFKIAAEECDCGWKTDITKRILK